MNRKLLAVVLLMTAAMVPLIGHANNPQYKSVVATFTKNTLFYNVVLRGDYLIVHDDAAMSVPGKHCTRIYHYGNGQVGALVTSFRCQPVSSESARQTNFSVISGVNLNRVTGFQIAGDEEIHAVP